VRASSVLPVRIRADATTTAKLNSVIASPDPI
jgi:hypothetical protein